MSRRSGGQIKRKKGKEGLKGYTLKLKQLVLLDRTRINLAIRGSVAGLNPL